MDDWNSNEFAAELGFVMAISVGLLLAIKRTCRCEYAAIH